MTHTQKRSMIWTMAITSAALFMVSLDNLVVTTAIPVIRRQLHASISQLEWTVNAYTLTFAVLLLTGAALGDRFGRRRVFALGLLLFTGASAAAALSTSANALDIARAVQGVGGAIVTPLTLTILSAAVPPARRGLALGIWGGIGGLAIALGPLVGGAIVDGISWHWIFWLNVPIGLVLAPLALSRLEETRGNESSLDLRGLALASSGLLGIVWGLVRGNAHGWTSLGIVGPIVGGLLLVAAFVAWELRAKSPMLPMEFFRSRTFALTNVSSLLMFFGMFGSIFLLAQFFQTVQGLSPLQSGLRIHNLGIRCSKISMCGQIQRFTHLGVCHINHGGLYRTHRCCTTPHVEDGRRSTPDNRRARVAELVNGYTAKALGGVLDN